MLRLAAVNAFNPPARAALTLSVVFVGAAAAVVFALFAAGVELSLRREARFLGADLLAISSEARYEPEEALMVGAPAGAYISGEALSALDEVKEIENWTPQLYFRSMKLGCCSVRDYPLVGFDPATDFVVRPPGSARLRAR